jgi:hypothetical protein
MYARIARFEGLDRSTIDDQLAEMRAQLDSTELPPDAPDEARTLMNTVARFMEFVDRDSGTSIGITFCETEDEMRRADEALNRMSPPAGAGSRTTVDVYELAIDKSFR